MQELFARYGLDYVSGPLPKQVASAWKKVFRLSLPNGLARKATAAISPTNVTRALFGSQTRTRMAEAAA